MLRPQKTGGLQKLSRSIFFDKTDLYPPRTFRRAFRRTFRRFFRQALRPRVGADGKDEQHQSDQKEHRQGGDAQVLPPGQVGDERDEEGAHKGRALAENIIDAEIFARLVLRDDLGKIGAGHRLDGALEQPDAHGEDPELVRPVEEHGIDGDGKVGDDAGEDEVLRPDLAREHPQQDRRGEGDDLRDEQRQNEACVRQPEVAPVGDGEVDDGVHAVDKEEERDQKEQDVLFCDDLPKGPAQAAQALAHGAVAPLDVVDLLVAAPQGRVQATHHTAVMRKTRIIAACKERMVCPSPTNRSGIAYRT